VNLAIKVLRMRGKDLKKFPHNFGFSEMDLISVNAVAIPLVVLLRIACILPQIES